MGKKHRQYLFIYALDVDERHFVLTLDEQSEHTHRPHNLQWCLLLLHPNGRPHRIQLSVLLSGIQIAGTKCSTLLRFGWRTSSSGEYGNAWSACRRWLVEAEEVKVVLGFITFSATISDSFALRIAALHSFRSSSVAKRTRQHLSTRA